MTTNGMASKGARDIVRQGPRIYGSERSRDILIAFIIIVAIILIILFTIEFLG